MEHKSANDVMIMLDLENHNNYQITSKTSINTTFLTDLVFGVVESFKI